VVTNAATAKRTAPLLVSGAVLHTLPAGSRFDLRARVLLAGPGMPDPAAAPDRLRLSTLADVPAGLRTRPRRIRAEGAFGDQYHPHAEASE
jgi:cyanophycinase